MLIQYIASNTGYMHGLALCLRLVLAAVCGGLIGFERKKNFKVAGLRTHILVCCGAALFMIISKYAFVDLVGSEGITLFGTRGADPARIAAQVVSGIGFLGAGVIFKNGVSIKGLTTAAGLWMTAGVGMAVGSGLLIIGLFAACFIAVLQLAMHKQSIGVDSYVMTNIRMVVPDGETASGIIQEITQRLRAIIATTRISRTEDERMEYSLTLKVSSELNPDKIEQIMKEYSVIIGVDVMS